MIERIGEFAKEHPLATTIAIGGASLALYNKLKPDHEPGENALEIMSNLVSCIEQEYANLPEEEQRPIPEYYVVGGGAVAALMDKDTKIDQDSNPPKVLPKASLFKAQYRKNGSLGDIDVVVRGNEIDADIIRAALTPNKLALQTGGKEEIAYELSKPGAKLKIGVTPLRTEADYLKKGLLKDLVSERVLDLNGNTSIRLLDINVALTAAYWRVWHQLLPNGIDYIPVMEPVVQGGNYIGRTEYPGPRKRDVPKLNDMEPMLVQNFGVSFRRDTKGKIIGIDAEDPTNPHYAPMIEFLDEIVKRDFKRNLKELDFAAAALFALKRALHKPADTYLEKVGQGGLIFDKVLSKISGERQQKLKRPTRKA